MTALETGLPVLSFTNPWTPLWTWKKNPKKQNKTKNQQHNFHNVSRYFTGNSLRPEQNQPNTCVHIYTLHKTTKSCSFKDTSYNPSSVWSSIGNGVQDHYHQINKPCQKKKKGWWVYYSSGLGPNRPDPVSLANLLSLVTLTTSAHQSVLRARPRDKNSDTI